MSGPLPAQPCPFCGQRTLSLVDEVPCVVHCASCGAMGPEADTLEEACELWDTGESTMGTVHVEETPHANFEGAMRLTLTVGQVLVCEVSYCASEVVPTLRGALLLMGSMRKANGE